MNNEAKDLNIGKKIKGLRIAQNISIKELSDRVGLTEAVIGQIEEDVVTPPVATLIKIARVLGVEVGYFFYEEILSRKIDVVRGYERKKVERKRVERPSPLSYSYESLSYRIEDKAMQPFLVEFDINIDEEIERLSHEGEEFLYLLNGELEFRSDKEVIILKKGDSIYFDSQIPHAFYGKGQEKPRAVAVIFSPKE